jgi:hypothetical protein
MRERRASNRLKLGPIVGHTDDASTRIWIQVFDDPADYSLRVQGAGIFPVESTEGGQLEFRTGIAVAEGLRPDRRYHYSILRRGRSVSGARGTFRTMPVPGSMASLLLCVISCSTTEYGGRWGRFAKFVEDAKPHFVLMVGDQVYIDEDKPDVFHDHLESEPEVRRRALAEKYRLNWAREPVRRVMANVPTYMMWDDHDIRDGWGSMAAESPTLRAKYPRGEQIFVKNNAFFEDARDVYWHFQGCRNPRRVPDEALVADRPLPGERKAMPFTFRCGRLAVLVIDSRGARDVFRKEFPALGGDQWDFVQQVIDKLPEDVEALAIVTPTPIASMDANGQVQKLLGDRTDDVVAFKRGRLKAAISPSSGGIEEAPTTIANVHLSRFYGIPFNLGRYKISNIDEARDQWSHKFVRAEQADLLRAAGRARATNMNRDAKRTLVFLSGDIHVGAIFDIASSKPDYKAVSLTSSGISAREDPIVTVGVFVDEDVRIGRVRSTLRDIVREFNFGVVQVTPTGKAAEINAALSHEGASYSVGIDVADLL